MYSISIAIDMGEAARSWPPVAGGEIYSALGIFP